VPNQTNLPNVPNYLASLASLASLACLAYLSLPFHQINIFHIHRIARAIDREDERKPDRGFGGGERDDEEREDLPRQVHRRRGGLDIAPERNQVDVHRVQHQLDAHQDCNGVAPCERAVQADAKERGGENEIEG
jgi:hypothetical protein